MRWFDRFRARMLTAGVGMILAGTIGCWDAPKRPNNFAGVNPRTGAGTAGQPGSNGWQGSANAAGGSPISRQTGGGLPLYDQKGQPMPRSSGPLGSGAPTSKASSPSSTNLLTPPGDTNDQQPIATSGAKPGTGIQPVNYGKSETAGGMPDPLKLPLSDGVAPSGPAVAPPPISAERLDTRPKFRSSPEIPTDSLSMPSAPPAPSKSGVLLMPPTP